MANLPDPTQLGKAALSLPTDAMNMGVRHVTEVAGAINAKAQEAGLPPVPLPVGGQALQLPPLPGMAPVGGTEITPAATRSQVVRGVQARQAVRSYLEK